VKRFSIVGLLIVLLSTGTAIAYRTHGNVGIGIQAGEPSGLSAKIWTGESTALDFALGWHPLTDRYSGQFAYQINLPLTINTGDLAVYSGLGAFVTYDTYSEDHPETPSESFVGFAGRVPVGVEWVFDPIGLYAQFDAYVKLLPETGMDFGGGIGIRFYF